MLSRRHACLRPWRWASPLSIIVKNPVCDGHFRADSGRRESVHPCEGAQGDAQTPGTFFQSFLSGMVPCRFCWPIRLSDLTHLIVSRLKN